MMRFYPFHVGDYQAHTSHLTDTEDLAYRRMLDLYYLGESALPDDAQWIARRIRMPAAIEEVRQILSEYFQPGEDGFQHNKRCDAEISSYQRMKTGGAKGAAKKWANKKGNDKGDGEGIEEANGEGTLTPIATKNQEPITKKKKSVVVQKPEEIEEILWDSYLEVRKKKSAPLTPIAFAGLIREAELADLTLTQALTICCEKNWVGFKAEWLEKEKVKFATDPDKFAGAL
jgi:uncharacterized protein YdaU (DUF1376 family)